MRAKTFFAKWYHEEQEEVQKKVGGYGFSFAHLNPRFAPLLSATTHPLLYEMRIVFLNLGKLS
jgi:hypothetical protein